jgi:hypothetical protein
MPNYVHFKKNGINYLLKASKEDFIEMVRDKNYDVDFGFVGGKKLSKIIFAYPELIPYKLINKLEDVL